MISQKLFTKALTLKKILKSLIQTLSFILIVMTVEISASTPMILPTHSATGMLEN